MMFCDDMMIFDALCDRFVMIHHDDIVIYREC